MIQWQTRADLLQVRKAVTNMEKNINPILEIKHLVKFFGEREILKDIDFNNYKGDVMFTFYNGDKVWNLCYNERLEKWITKYS